DSAVAALFSGGEFRYERWELWLKIGDDCEFLEILDDEDRSQLRRVRLLWLELQAQAGRLDPVSWMRAALDRSGAWGAYSVGRRGEQALANLGKFLDLVRDICEEQGPNLVALAERLTLECDRADSEAESEADISAGQGVRIMTIHSAKGLEFPVVILPLPSTSQKLRLPLTRGNLLAEESEYRPLTSPRLHDLSSNFADKKYVTNLHDVMYHCCSKPEELAEQLRLLYVAATRSQDRLLVVPHAGFKKKDGSLDLGKDSLSELWLRACDADFEALGERCLQPADGIQDLGNLLNTPSDMRFSWIPANSISVSGTAESVSDLPLKPPPFDSVSHPGVEIAQPGRSVLVQVPLEAFAAWIANPTEEKARWLLSVGADENGTGTGISRASASKGGDYGQEIQAEPTQAVNVPQLSGVVFHQLMQRFGPGMAWSAAEDWVRRWVKRLNLDAKSRAAVVERVRMLVDANSGYSWAGAANARRELSVLLRLGDVILRGRIDLAWMENQTAVALDLKTNDVEVDKLDELTEQHGYDHQAKLYSLAYAASMGVDTAEGRLLFLPEKYEKRWGGVQDEREWYVARAAELVSHAEVFQYSAYAQESMTKL
ncbi:MAG TPA: hypothetical protein ENH10_02290, partial [Bacteroidetes bacterium]|nr:hypothetical protein [Bacteroidota bacterium]HEX03970.1 hypothetical protein [Bacteroidota bacterium]